VKVELELIGKAAFEARSPNGAFVIDGSPEIGGEGRGMRPMEVLLGAQASCAAMDVVHILRKQREPLQTLRIVVEGDRKEAVPAPFVRIRIEFVANAGVDLHKLERAVQLGVEKYCSVGASLDPAITVSWQARVEV
jgi:putative redox protein